MTNEVLVKTSLELGKLKKRKSLSEVLKSNGLIPQEKLDKALIILLDGSGSMADYMNDTETKMNVAWKVLTHDLPNKLADWNFGLLLFAHRPTWWIPVGQDVNRLKNSIEPTPDAYTPMQKALNVAWTWARQNVKEARFILITDGCPTDSTPDDILNVARDYKSIPVDTVGIGRGHDSFSYDPIFLKRLSDLTGGMFVEATSPQMLLDTIQQLSPAQRPLLGNAK
jgi:hypothetical protein